MTLLISGRTLTVYGLEAELPGKQVQISGLVKPVVYLHIYEEEEGAAVYKLLQGKCILICISGNVWEKEFTPWPAAAIDKRQGQFSGGAPAYVRLLTETIIPEAEQRLQLNVQKRILAGYSLAGLFALYAACESHLFDGVASASGSLWYENFVEWAGNHFPRGRWDGLTTVPVYLSLGDKESRSKNVLLQQNEKVLRAVAAAWDAHNRVKVELNPGGHFQDAELRTARGILWVLGQV